MWDSIIKNEMIDLGFTEEEFDFTVKGDPVKITINVSKERVMEVMDGFSEQIKRDIYLLTIKASGVKWKRPRKKRGEKATNKGGW